MSRTHFISKTFVCISFLLSANSYSQKVQTFIYDCVLTGQNLVVDAVVTGAGPSTFYHWQYKTQNSWTCFVNGLNNINGTNFNVSGATGTGANNAPALTINAATIAVENLMVRLVMSSNADPCANPAPPVIWGGDGQDANDTKYLRLHISSNSLSCPPNAFSCAGNMLVNSGKYYGGFENTDFDISAENYIRRNFAVNNASSDYSFGTGPGHYQDINNPFAMNNGFDKNIAPHSGDYQLVVEGAFSSTDKAWYKTINVTAGKQYAFTAWIARVDQSQPLIELRANTTVLAAAEMNAFPVGDWVQLQGTFTAIVSGEINFNIRDSKLGGHNFSLDDICLRECSNCSILELHQLNLTATLSKDEIKLKWVAENEMGTASFIIERSFDGSNYERIASKNITGPSNTPTNYYYNDLVQNAGVSNVIYYRVKAMDIGGRYAYSNVVIIRLGKNAAVQAWPVPFDDYVNISYSATTNSKLDISLTNAVGKIIRRSSFSVIRGLNQLALTDLQALPPGPYFLRISDQGTNQVYTRSISK